MAEKDFDKEFAKHVLPSCVFSNSQREDDGTFRRMVITTGGVDFTLPNTFTFDQIDQVARVVDQVAYANEAAGRESAQAAIRRALGINPR